MAKANDTPHALVKPSLHRLIDRSVAIETESAQESGDLGFMARSMVQATLPHKKVDGNEFVRKNGNYTMTLLSPSEIGLPYGTIPRLLLAWLTTEAVKTQSRELELGDSLSSFMRELDMIPTGGKWGSITRLKDQTLRLFSCTVSASYKDAKKNAGLGYRIADRSMLWWDSKESGQNGSWQSTVRLSEDFFNEIIQHPIPVDMRALKALRKSPLALDTYCWLTHRASYNYAKPSSLIPWSALANQFGSDYKLLRQFKAAFLEELRKVITVYGGAKVEVTDKGLVIKPSLPHIRKRGL